MRIRHIADAPTSGASAHRAGGISFVHLMEGDEGAPDNFALTIVDIADGYVTPRHRHNFEQLRIMLDGNFEFGPDLKQEPGSVGYFCEGTYYTQRGVGSSKTLLLQVAGASGAGYLSQALMRKTIEALQQRGTFSNGVFTWEEDGKRHNKDGYEAAWEAANGRTIAYSAPRYNAPILMNPDHFGFVSLTPGVDRKFLGRFNERGLDVAQLRMAAGTRYRIDATDQPILLYALSGAGNLADSQWFTGSTTWAERGDVLELAAEDDALFYMIGLPVFDQASVSFDKRAA
ncbi:hypothetical protein [Sphingobium algorifonticola]|uniref:Uncharacterized protein n=1 Tax=Sphingobium algorifonticola TaxID=2008318 RepID=A0A437JAD4_9SPHN|nr:hypothetical protein [Sphingobium algorifonticola]RVT42343.1 hypothetical protein ENE74_09120 [Sphingobium algorifonticola]